MVRLKPAHLAELRELHDLGHAIVDALATVDQLGELGPQLKRALAGALDTQNLRGLRQSVRDLGDMLAALPPAQRQEATLTIERSTGSVFQRLQQEDGRAAAAIVRRGRIRNQREYHLLRSHLEHLEADPARAAEAAPILHLLENYRVS
jgi:hypothetical protein